MSRPLSIDDHTVEISHGQVYIYSARSARPEDDAGGTSLRQAERSGRYVGECDGAIDFISPVAYNFTTPMRVEVWDGEPPDDDENWDHVVDVDFDVHDDTLYFQGSGGRPPIAVGSRSGRYRARLSGRGYDLAWFDRVEDMDSYRMRLWPRRMLRAPQLRKRWAGWDKLA